MLFTMNELRLMFSVGHITAQEHSRYSDGDRRNVKVSTFHPSSRWVKEISKRFFTEKGFHVACSSRAHARWHTAPRYMRVDRCTHSRTLRKGTRARCRESGNSRAFTSRAIARFSAPGTAPGKLGGCIPYAATRHHIGVSTLQYIGYHPSPDLIRFLVKNSICTDAVDFS